MHPAVSMEAWAVTCVIVAWFVLLLVFGPFSWKAEPPPAFFHVTNTATFPAQKRVERDNITHAMEQCVSAIHVVVEPRRAEESELGYFHVGTPDPCI